jgi:hypothetical protein
MVDRRIIEGRLGCPICESQYPIHGGIADLRTEPTAVQEPETRPYTALELAALMGVTQGPGFALLSGGMPTLAAELAETVADLEWIELGRSFAARPERAGVNRLSVNNGIVPLRAGTVRGAIVLDRGRSLRDIVRSLRPAARLVLAQPDDAAIAELNDLGMRTLVRNDALLVAEKSS